MLSKGLQATDAPFVQPAASSSPQALVARPSMPTSPPQLWLCHVCGNLNKPQRVRCNMMVCQAPKGFPGPFKEDLAVVANASIDEAASKWRCPVCLDWNRARRTQCYKAECPGTKPSTPPQNQQPPAPTQFFHQGHQPLSLPPMGAMPFPAVTSFMNASPVTTLAQGFGIVTVGASTLTQWQHAMFPATNAVQGITFFQD